MDHPGVRASVDERFLTHLHRITQGDLLVGVNVRELGDVQARQARLVLAELLEQLRVLGLRGQIDDQIGFSR